MEVDKLALENVEKSNKISQILNQLILDEKTGRRIIDVFESELEAGMKDGLAGSSLQMENTYVPELMTGEEKGRFLALDLGGTNFRVILLVIESGKIVREEVAYYSVPEEKRLGHGTDLFDFLADCIYDFVRKNDLADEKLPLGFTFSFPMTQNALDSGILVTWTKSFNCSGVVGTDAVKHLNEAIKRNGNLTVEVVAILNDTTGTLVKGSYDNPDTCIGLILGTGCNGAYLEKADKVIRWGGHKYHTEDVIIDPEFGAFGDNGCSDFIKSEFDVALDKASLLPGSFTYEKYFAGKYIGKLVRLILVKLHAENLVFSGQTAPKLNQEDSFTSSHLSRVEEGEAEKVIKEAFDIPTESIAEDDVDVLKHVCSVLSHRCALLVAIPLSVFLRRMNRGSEEKPAAIAVTGSLYKCHPKLKGLLEKYVEKYSAGVKSYTFLSDDGSGKGAGLVAAIAQRIAQR